MFYPYSPSVFFFAPACCVPRSRSPAHRPGRRHGRVITPQGSARIEGVIRALDASGKAQLQVLTVPTLDGEAVEPFGIRVAEAWKIGRAKKITASS